MQITFGRFSNDPSRGPAEATLELRPADPADAGRIDMTALALEKGPAGFVAGNGPVRRIVAPLDPTLDDMMAALLIESLLEGKECPPTAAFARYLASVRKGLRPTDSVPLEESPEGLFLALRNKAGDPLSEEARAASFLAGWKRLAAELSAALVRGADPHREVLFGADSPFEEERQYLRRDREVYERDRAAGQRWLLQLPGEEAPVPALYLRCPKSFLFKFWARNDQTVPSGTGFRFLGVWWGKDTPSEWVFSTDPLDRRPIDTLASALQQAEVAHDPKRGASDPWYDGQRHGHTLVAAPRGGTRLTEAEVLEVVSRWGKRWPLRQMSSVLTWGLTASLALMLLIGLIVWLRRDTDRNDNGGGKSGPVITGGSTAKGDTFDPEVIKELNERHVLPLRDVTLPDRSEPWHQVEFELDNPGTATLPIRFRISIPSFFKTLPVAPQVKVSLRGGKESEPLPVRKNEGEPWRSDPARLKLAPGKNTVVVSLAEPVPGKSLSLQAVWEPNHKGVIHLHVFAVGVSKYKHFPKPLRYAHDDARDLSTAFSRQRLLFDEVHVFPALLNEEATRARIEDDLGRFAEKVKRDPAAVKLAVVLFSGHGSVVAGEYFIFLPHDYEEERNSTRVMWQNIEAPLREMGCPVLLVLDACHSGQAGFQVKGSKSAAEIQDAALALAEAKPEIMVLTSALPEQQSFEDDKWKHGALSLALLEVLAGRQLYAPNRELDLPSTDEVLSLSDLEYYAGRRVRELVTRDGRKQTVILKTSPRLDKKSIPIAVHPRQP